MATQTILGEASRQWYSRPDDQRFTSLEELMAAVSQRKAESWTAPIGPEELRVLPAGEDGADLTVTLFDPSARESRALEPSHWSFGQLASYAQAPGHYLRQLPADLAAINIQWGLEHRPVRDNVLVMGQSNGRDILRSMTSTSYGRIWDEDVVKAVERVNHNGQWKIPAASYAATNPKRATTLYASDRDVFIFLVDPDHAIQVGEDTLFRGFYTWNSEVGSQVFGLSTFLYRYVCDNRLIWGATNVQEIRIRHTRGAPERFAYEGQKALQNYAEESPQRVIDAVTHAKTYEVPKADKEGDGWEKWLQDRGFTGATARAAVKTAEAEQGEARSLWDIIQGITANARQMPHTDDRVKMEAAAGKLMRYVDPVAK